MYLPQHDSRLLCELVRHSRPMHRLRVADLCTGSGCIAALEAEKYLAELEDKDNEGPDLEGERDKGAVKKGDVNGADNVPEYRSNPLL